MKKYIAIITAIILLLLPVCSCTNTVQHGDKLNIVCTIFPVYDWVRQLTVSRSDKTEISMLLDSGVDLHSFQPGVEDIIKISDCDIFIYVGGESDKWVKDALSEATNKNMTVINLFDVLGDDIKAEETVEGMQVEKDEHDDEVENDEHIWLSLRYAVKICNFISDKLAATDPDGAAAYTADCKAYTEKLELLDKRYRQTVESAKYKTVLVADRFPLRYLVDDYGIGYYAAFVGCSSETAASFETVAFLASKLDELGLSYVLTLDNSNQDIARTVISSTKNKNQQILTINSLQSVDNKDVASGETYLKIMESNLNVLAQALT